MNMTARGIFSKLLYKSNSYSYKINTWGKCALYIMICYFILTQTVLLTPQTTFICPQKVWNVWQQTLEIGCKLKPHLIHYDREDLKSVRRHEILTLCKHLSFHKDAVTIHCKLTPTLSSGRPPPTTQT